MKSAEDFQPQGRDTTNGPTIHTYIPRADGTIVIGGITYAPQTGSTSVPAPVAASVPAVTVAAAQPVPTETYYTPPGGPSAPVNMPQAYMATPPQPMYYPPEYQPAHQTTYPAALYNMTGAANHGIFTNHIHQPAYGAWGMTGNDLHQSQMAAAENLEMNAKQEMKPADDDPNRMYWCREEDGTYLQRNRRTIDSGDIGDCRWYIADGVFYAVRLPSG